MNVTPQNVCGFLIRSRLMAPEEMRKMFERWQAEAGSNSANLGLFTKWLVAHQYVTDYQATLLAKGRGDPNYFFLGQYKILERLGRGRMAGVYKARHILGQVVAIKVLPPSRAKNPQILLRFQREARLAVRLKHPNVVRAFQIGQDRGLHYLVMECLEGETVGEVLQRRQRLPPAEAVRLVHHALQGLQHIHEQGMVHRDMKPANLMLVPAPAPGELDTTMRSMVKILDIGLGRALFDENAPASESELTGEGVILGTPDYLAPEQARDAHASDIRADIYSLGCVLYHLLAGQPPFPDTSLVNQLVRHSSETAKPLQQFNPAVPAGLQQIVNFMMAKQPAQRFATPARAALALHKFLADSKLNQPVTETPPMRQFLSWLETAPEPAETVPLPVDQKIGNLPIAKPRSSKPTPGPRSDAARLNTGKPADSKQLIVSPAQLAAAIDSQEVDVELIAAPATTVPAENLRKLGLTKRQWMLVGIGAGALTVIVVLGILFALLYN